MRRGFGLSTSTLRGSALAAGVALSLASESALAAPARAEASLTFERQAGAEACPDESVLRQQITGRVGYDPFRADAERHVDVVFYANAHGLAARVTTAGGDAREIESEGSDCSDLTHSVVLAVSLAIDPLTFAPPPSEPIPAPPAPKTDEAANHAATPHAAERPDASASGETTPTAELTMGGRFGGAILPGPSAGPVVNVAYRRPHWSVFGEAGLDLSTEKATQTVPSTWFGQRVNVNAMLVRGGGGACANLSLLSLCGRVDLGALQGSNETAGTHMTTTLYVDVALVAKLSVPLRRDLHIVLGGETQAPLNRTTLAVNGVDIWTTPTIGAAFDLGLAYRF